MFCIQFALSSLRFRSIPILIFPSSRELSLVLILFVSQSLSLSRYLYLSLSFSSWRHRQGNSLNILAAKHDIKTATYDNLKFYLVVIQLETNSIAFHAGLTIICFTFQHFLLLFYFSSWYDPNFVNDREIDRLRLRNAQKPMNIIYWWWNENMSQN